MKQKIFILGPDSEQEYRGKEKSDTMSMTALITHALDF